MFETIDASAVWAPYGRFGSAMDFGLVWVASVAAAVAVILVFRRVYAVAALREDLRVAQEQVQQLQRQEPRVQKGAQKMQTDDDERKQFPAEIWITPTGARYHINQSCGGRGSHKYTPCMTCVR